MRVLSQPPPRHILPKFSVPNYPMAGDSLIIRESPAFQVVDSRVSALLRQKVRGDPLNASWELQACLLLSLAA